MQMMQVQLNVQNVHVEPHGFAGSCCFVIIVTSIRDCTSIFEMGRPKVICLAATPAAAADEFICASRIILHKSNKSTKKANPGCLGLHLHLASQLTLKCRHHTSFDLDINSCLIPLVSFLHFQSGSSLSL